MQASSGVRAEIRVWQSFKACDFRHWTEPNLCACLGQDPSSSRQKLLPEVLLNYPDLGSSSIWALSLGNSFLRGVHGTLQHVTYRTLVRHAARLFHPLSPCL